MAKSAVLLWALLALAGPLHAREDHPDGTVPVPAIVRAAWILGQELFDAQGDSLGKIEDLLLDRDQNRVAALAVAAPGEDREAANIGLGGAWLEPRAGGGLEIRTGPQAGSMSTSPAPDTRSLRRASEVMDAELRERGGADIGDVNDLAIRLEDGAVVHLVVRFDPHAYAGEGEVSLPMGSVEPRGGDFVARFDPQDLRPISPARAASRAGREARLTRLIGARVVDERGGEMGRVADVVIEAAERKVTHLVVRSAAGQAAYPLEEALAVRGGDAAVIEVDAARLAKLPAAGPAARLLGSRVLAAQVTAPDGSDVGDVEDVVVNLGTGRLRYAVARFDEDWVQRGTLVAVPMRPLEAADGGGDLAMRFALNELNTAYFFPEGRWPDVDDPAFRARIERHVTR